MSKTIDYTVFIGRFQIPHHGHFEVMKTALKESNTLIIAIGSANVGRSLRNPFSWEQRATFIEHCEVPEIVEALKAGRIKFIPIEDSPYSDQWWVEQVQRKVRSVTGSDANVALIGSKKDETSYYLDMFPQWKLIETVPTKMYAATDARNAYYEFGVDTSGANKLHDFTTQGVIEALKFVPAFVHETLQKRYKEVVEYRKQWGMGPFYTVDSVVIKNGHILCIKRANESINSMLWALPGGFRDKSDSTAYNGALRELKEETGLDLSIKKLYEAQCVATHRFDKADRDDRANIITDAFCFKLLDTGPFPEVEGLDDAAHAEWVPLVDLNASNMFNDHYFIIRKLIAGL